MSLSRFLTAALLLTVVTPSFEELSAQEEVNPVLTGQVMAGSDPLPDATVVLHRVSAEASGEIDSVRAGPDGTFTLPLPRVPDHGREAEVFFAAVRYRGLLYLGEAITSPDQLDSLYLIQAYDTLSVPPGGADLSVTQRSLFLEKVEEGWEATDFFQVVQEEDRTLYSPGDGVVWSYPLPAGARDFQVGQSDLPPDAFGFSEGRFQVYSPLPPGDRYFLVRYSLHGDDLSIPTPGVIQRMEVLIREPGPGADFTHLVPGPPVELEPGDTFRSYQAANLQVPLVEGRIVGGAFEIPASWLAVLLTALLAGAGVWGFRRRTGRRGEVPAGEGAPPRNELLRAIAELDASFEGVAEPSPGDLERYRERRGALLARLKTLS